MTTPSPETAKSLKTEREQYIKDTFYKMYPNRKKFEDRDPVSIYIYGKYDNPHWFSPLGLVIVLIISVVILMVFIWKIKKIYGEEYDSCKENNKRNPIRTNCREERDENTLPHVYGVLIFAFASIALAGASIYYVYRYARYKKLEDSIDMTAAVSQKSLKGELYFNKNGDVIRNDMSIDDDP